MVCNQRYRNELYCTPSDSMHDLRVRCDRCKWIGCMGACCVGWLLSHADNLCWCTIKNLCRCDQHRALWHSPNRGRMARVRIAFMGN